MKEFRLSNFEFQKINHKINHRHLFNHLIWTFDLEMPEDVEAQLDIDLHTKHEYKSSQDTPLPPPQQRTISYRARGSTESMDKVFTFLENSKETFYDLTQDQAKGNESFSVQTIFMNRWYCHKDWLLGNTRIGTYIAKDSQSFYMGPHIDNALTVGTFIINLQDNGECGTEFFAYDGASVFKASGEKGKGVFFVNTPGAVHGITHSLDRDRFVVLGNWMLNYFG